MSEFIDAQDIAIRNRIAVDGRVNPTVEDWNDLLTHIDRLEQENAELREFVIYCQGFLGCEEARDSMALHSITLSAKELLNK